MAESMAGSMTGSVLVVVIVVVAGVLYLLLRRRGVRRSEEMRPLPGAGATAEEASETRPSGTSGPSGPVANGLPPKPRSGDRGSSHPGYPVAPAKYSGGVPVKPGAPGQPTVYGAAASRPELDPVAEARKAANAPAPTEPWYPEAPANYAEGEEPGEDGRGPV